MNQSDLYTKINRGPTFLLLGQDYLRLESSTDPFLSEVLRKYGGADATLAYYGQLFNGDAYKQGEAALAWMQSLCERLSPPQWLKSIASFPWNGVYSSAIDVIWVRSLRLDRRELQPLMDVKYRPSDPRNRSKLLCTFLYGSVNRVEEAERPPLTQREWSKRKHIAITLARRLPEIITPLGTLLIEGYAGERDWFSPDDLAPILDDLNPDQTHMFSAKENLKKELANHPYMADLLKENKLILHDESLSSFLLQGEAGGLLQLGERPDKGEFDRRIQLGETFSMVPSHIWNQVSRSAIILDDIILLPSSKVSKEKRYSEFRNFLSESSTRPPWSGYEQGYAFKREFEKELFKEVTERLRTGGLQRSPVILHGQTGTGKTVALGALAYEIRKNRQYPVLFIERKSQKPINSDIDVFCKWAEDNGAGASLIIWDGMSEVEQYYDLLQYLVGRGRKVVVVGSSYKLDTKKPSKQNLIEAPANLQKSELAAFSTFLNDFDPLLSQMVDKQLRKPGDLSDPTFLVALYRMLPPARAMIRSGVLKEIGLTEQKIQRIVQEEKPEVGYEGALAYALWKAGLITNELLLSSNVEDFGGVEVSEAEKMVGLIMVPGSLGLKVPIELLLRALGKQGIIYFINLLNRFDIFRWYEDAIGNISIGPRHPLEAKFVVQGRLGVTSTEVKYIKQLLIEVHDNEGILDDREIQFAVDLVRSVRPEERFGVYGADINKFVPYLRELAETLGQLREERNVQNPRLLLQEATFLRDAVVEQSRAGRPYADANELLDRAEIIANQALRLLDRGSRTGKLRSRVLVALASILGTKLRQGLDSGMQPRDELYLFDTVREEIFKARALDPENFYPIDVFAWVTKALLESNDLDADARADAEADILYIFEMTDTEDFSVLQKERFDTRRMQIAEVIHNFEMSEDAFLSLIAQGSSAGYYLKARTIAGEIANQELDKDQIKRYHAAANYLEEHREQISQDGRCLHLLLRLWWMERTGKPMFYRERQVLPFMLNDWKYCQGIILDLMNAEEFYVTPSIKYFCGLAAFHLGNVEDAFEIFKELERESDYGQGRRRILRSYLASTPNGKPKVYAGTVEWVNEEGTRGSVYVEELRRRVPFIPLDFGRKSIQKFEVLSEFHLAFNFIAPIADPTERYNWAQQERGS